MQIKSYFAIFSLFVVLLCCVSAISAVSDDTMNNTVSEVESGEDSPSINIDEQSGDVDQKVSASSTQEKINVEPTTKTFTQLKEDIHQPMTHFFLYDNYTYTSSDSDLKEGITIDRFMVIHGHGNTIDGSKQARFFTVKAEGVEIHNIIFKNSYTEGSMFDFSDNKQYGAAISGPVTLINCTFVDNVAYLNHEDDYLCAAAVYKATAINCTFIHNKMDCPPDPYLNINFFGAAMYKGTAINCTFIENSLSAISDGGATYDVDAFNCTFIGNSANNGGAMAHGSATLCTFINNTASYGQAVMGTTVILCIFENNSAAGGNIISGIFNASNFTTTYHSGEKFTFNLTCDNKTFDGLNATIEIRQNDTIIGTYHALSGADGGLIFDLKPGTYKAILSMDKFDVQQSTIAVNILTPTKILANNVTTIFNKADELLITLVDYKNNALNNTQITVNFNNVSANYTTNESGQVKIDLKKLAANNYTAVISFAGNESYAASNASVKITVNKDSPNLAAEPITATYNVDEELVIILKDSLGNPIQSQDLTVNFGSGDNNYRTDVNGQVKINVAGLVPKAYAVSIKFAGNENYSNVAISSKMTVNKATPKLIAKKATFKVKTKTKKYKVTLKNNKGKALKKAAVTLKVKGKTYKAKTNNKGVATFKITKLTKKGTFKTKVAFKGNSYYKAVSKSIKIKVK